MLSGAVAFDTDWGGSYRLASLTRCDTFADGELAEPIQVRPTFGKLVRDEGERVRLRCGVELRELRAVALPGSG